MVIINPIDGCYFKVSNFDFNPVCRDGEGDENMLDVQEATDGTGITGDSTQEQNSATQDLSTIVGFFPPSTNFV